MKYDNQHRHNTNTNTKRPPKVSRSLVLTGLALLAAELILSGLFIYFAINLGIFPVWMLIVIIVLIIGFFILVFACEKSRKKPAKIAGIVISVIMCVVLLAGNIIMVKADNMLSSITGNSFSTSTYNVAVRKNNPASDIKDISSGIFGTATSVESEKYAIVMESINEEAGKTVSTYDVNSIRALYDALADGTVDAIVYDSAFQSVFEDTDINFESEVKVIATYKARIKVPTIAPKTNVTTEPFTVLISGSDEWGPDIPLEGRSDVNILCVVNPVTFQALIVSIPRDYYVPFTGISGDERDKLTHAGLYGIDVLQDSVCDLFDIDSIDYYVRLNFNSLIFLVDDIDGIDIDNPYYFECTYQDLAFEEGMIHLNGEEALWYARERKNLDNGDLERGVHQMMIIEAMVNKLTSAAGMIHINELLDDIPKVARTNMPEENIKSLVQYQLQKNSSWDMQKVQAVGEGAYQPSFAAGGDYLYVSIPYKESVKYIHDLVADIMNGKLISADADSYPECKTLLYEMIGDGERPDDGSDSEDEEYEADEADEEPADYTDDEDEVYYEEESEEYTEESEEE